MYFNMCNFIFKILSIRRDMSEVQEYAGWWINAPFSGVKYPRLDCAILGMGPDGHTCSLFPGATESLLAKSWVIPVVDSPKPPPNRVSLTLPFLNSARVAIFPITGSSKSSTVKVFLSFLKLGRNQFKMFKLYKWKMTRGNL